MRTLFLKAWYVACAIFCILSLQKLAEERYEVAIFAANQSENDPITFSVCSKLSSFQLDKTEIRLEELRAVLLNYFNRLNYPFDEYDDLTWLKPLFLNKLKTGQYLIFNDLLCILLKYKREGSDMYRILSNPVYFAFRNSTLDFSRIDNWGSSFDQLIVKKRGPPYSNCSESNRRFRCLNECFKNKFRLSRYFYDGNETGPIQLRTATNQTIEESEKNCFAECWRENCEIVQLFPFSESRKPEITRLEVQPKQSDFDFYVQFIGLVCSFANISLNQLTSFVIHFASSKVKRRRVRIALFCLKWAILFLSLAYCCCLYISMTLDCKAEERNPLKNEIMRNNIKQKSVRLAICVDIEEYFNSDFFELNDLNKTMSEIEKATDSVLNDNLKSIHLNYQGRMFKVDYTLEPKVLFSYFLGVIRCFILRIFPNYQWMPSNPKLTIKFKKYFILYLLTENENLNEKTLRYSERAFMKRVVRRLERNGRCVDYRERYKNCTSRLHCVERCINKEALEKFKKIAIGQAVVDKDQFNHIGWNNTYPMEIPYSGPDHSTYKTIREECGKKIQYEPPCEEVTFKETVGIIQPDGRTMEIDLFIDVELSIEEFSWFNLLLNIMSTHSSFLSMNVLSLLAMLYSFIKQQLLNRLRNDKIAHFLIYLLCSLGFTYHAYRLFDLSVNGQLTYNPNYEAVNRTRMPLMVFCLPIEEKLIDKNHQLTGHYLEQVTSDITPTSLFESILYLNESNEWTSLNLSLVGRFFFMHFKCFNVTIEQEYDKRQFHFSNSQVLKANFTKIMKEETKGKPLFFMTKTHETGFSNVANLVYKLQYGRYYNRYSAEQSEMTVKYEDRFSFLKRFLSTPNEDEFNDLDGQLSELKHSGLHFKTLKLPVKERDFDCEVRDDLFEQLFIQVKHGTAGNSLDSADYQQTFLFNQLREVYYSSKSYDSSFTFSLGLIKKTLWKNNGVDFAKLVSNLPNVLFIWFDLGILDLHPIFILSHDYLLVYLYLHLPAYLIDKITQFLIFSHRWLKKFETPLYKRLDSRKQTPPQTSQA